MPTFAGIRLEGRSIAGVFTSVELPELGVVFDLGACSTTAFRHSHVFVSHGHVDHCAALAAHASIRLLNGLPGARYVTSPELRPRVDSLFRAAEELAENELPREVVELAPGRGEIAIHKRLLARAFAGDHRVPSQGYVLSQAREVLLPEFVGRPPAEIAAARAAGQVVASEQRVPHVVFSGDTRIEAIDREPDAWRAKMLILEATYLDPAHTVEEARRRGHIHLDEILERADRFENEVIVLMHFSARYRDVDVEEWLRKRIPQRLRGRVVALL